MLVECKGYQSFTFFKALTQGVYQSLLIWRRRDICVVRTGVKMMTLPRVCLFIFCFIIMADSGPTSGHKARFYHFVWCMPCTRHVRGIMYVVAFPPEFRHLTGPTLSTPCAISYLDYHQVRHDIAWFDRDESAVGVLTNRLEAEAFMVKMLPAPLPPLDTRFSRTRGVQMT